MPTEIKQVEDGLRNKTILQVKGEMFRDDALLLERIAVEMREDLGKNITLDLSDLSFLDSESASVLKRLEREKGFELEGLEIFLQKAVSDSEK